MAVECGDPGGELHFEEPIFINTLMAADLVNVVQCSAASGVS